MIIFQVMSRQTNLQYLLSFWKENWRFNCRLGHVLVEWTSDSRNGNHWKYCDNSDPWPSKVWKWEHKDKNYNENSTLKEATRLGVRRGTFENQWPSTKCDPDCCFRFRDLKNYCWRSKFEANLRRPCDCWWTSKGAQNPFLSSWSRQRRRRAEVAKHE